MSIALGPGSAFGNYRIESLLGRGGMSVVYLAQDQRLGRRAAIKVLAPELAADESFRTRFIRESQLAAGLEHPNIVPVYDAGEVEGHLFIAMRYVRGTDLRTLISNEGTFGPDRTVAVLRPVAAALDAAHRRGLVHRDVKPANILVAIDEGEEHPYLSDFGLTKHTSSKSGLTKTGQFMGTVDYVAPEQIKGEEVDGRTDEYSLACVLFQCLTGEVPFNKPADVATMFGHLQDPPPKVTAIRADLPSEIDDVVSRGMAKERQDRFPTCAAMLDALARAVGLPSGPREAPSIGATVVAMAPQPSTGPLLPPAPEGVSAAPGSVVSEPATAPPTGERPGRRAPNVRLLVVLGGAVAAIAAAVVVVLSLGGEDPPLEPIPSQTGPSPPTVVANTLGITIPAFGQASPYPSTIEVAGRTGRLADVNVTLRGFDHAFLDDVDVLLVGPSGESVVLLSDVGGAETGTDLTLTFDDAAPEALGDEEALGSGTFQPSSGGTGSGFEGVAPAPSPPFATALSVFDGTDANGTWTLFVFDDSDQDGGEIAGGWSLELAFVDGATTPTGSTGGPTTPTGATGDPGSPTIVEFSNDGSITVPGFGQGVPYPSEIQVSGLPGTILDVDVSMDGLKHGFADDVDVLLVGPTGLGVVLMADAGGSNRLNGRVTLVFDDQAGAILRTGRLPTASTVAPREFAPGFEGDFPAPAPPYFTVLSEFNGTDPNGIWQLYVFDDASGDRGALRRGWSLQITVA